jgi:hypothetical protein
MARPFRSRGRRGGIRKDIRPVRGFGKFEGCDATDIYAYDYVTNGFSSDIASSEFGGESATLIECDFRRNGDLYGSIDLLRYYTTSNRLNRAERRYIRKMVGAIVYESSYGFVTVNWYTCPKHLARDWEAVRDEIEYVEID